MIVTVINGPNLNLLGSREPHLYGTTTLAQLEEKLRRQAESHDVQMEFHQSNHEGALIDVIHRQITTAAAIIINGGGYSHTSVALADALKTFNGLKIEVHLSNIFARESIRHYSFLAGVCQATISGLGIFGYEAALNYCIRELGHD